jgi:hypothetical protein
MRLRRRLGKERRAMSCELCLDDDSDCPECEPPEPERYQTDISGGPLDWCERANAYGFSWRGWARHFYNQRHNRLHDISTRESPLMARIREERALVDTYIACPEAFEHRLVAFPLR